ncbi:hypothetical protein RhiirA4_476279 [Rhizophagus irregularis]|uniref:Uncharacterized protein n=1 Tax=Rhizophagus irregularis TaxID=588596 RepID=A0A2I1HBG7_9GLOM|nr:hypothetical protein RhiirA4_476279 [Rhizophagus irregularis]
MEIYVTFPVVLIDNNNSTIRPASFGKHTNKKPKVSSEPYTLQKPAQPTSTEIDENIIKDVYVLPPGTGDIADNSLTLDVSSKNLQHQAETANASCSTTQSGRSAFTDMEMDQPVDPASTSTQQQRTIPVVPVDPILILPNLVIATPADTVKGKSASDKKTHIRRFFGTNGVTTASETLLTFPVFFFIGLLAHFWSGILKMETFLTFRYFICFIELSACETKWFNFWEFEIQKTVSACL